MGKRFGVFLYQSGGCDYTIGCGEKFVILPESIQTMEAAVQYVTEEQEEGCLDYHGGDEIDKCVIHEIANSQTVDIDSLHEERRKAAENHVREERRQQYEQLKQEFEP